MVNQKRRKYKERAKKYKALLSKRDIEIMDLVVENKELRSQMERDMKKHQDVKHKLKNELMFLKEEMQSLNKK